MAAAMREELQCGSSYWEITGGFTGETRHMVTCTIHRPQVSEVKQIVARVDPRAFLTIGISHQAMGSGFTPLLPAKNKGGQA